jgi:uncharacterized protein (TIGR00369 family)
VASPRTKKAAAKKPAAKSPAEKKEKVVVRTKTGLKQYTYLGCPLTRNRSPWCFRLCIPDAEGHGECGRVAPHGFKSRIQQGIEDFQKRQWAEHYQKLENMYIAAPCNDHFEPGIRVGEGMAEIVIPVRKRFFHAGGSVHGSVYFKALDDAAYFAVNSLVQNVMLVTASFDITFTRPIAQGKMIARGRFLEKSGNDYLAESAVVNSDGKEIGRGHGVFVPTKIRLTEEMGYK